MRVDVQEIGIAGEYAYLHTKSRVTTAMENAQWRKEEAVVSTIWGGWIAIARYHYYRKDAQSSKTDIQANIESWIQDAVGHALNLFRASQAKGCSCQRHVNECGEWCMLKKENLSRATAGAIMGQWQIGTCMTPNPPMKLKIFLPACHSLKYPQWCVCHSSSFNWSNHLYQFHDLDCIVLLSFIPNSGVQRR